MSKLTGGQAIVKSLMAQGVDTIFGVPGVHNDWFYNALYDEMRDGGNIRHVTTRHEQGAGYMALGYALSSDKVGVFAVVPGAGLLNASTALATGFGLYQRMLGVVGQNPSAYLERGIGFLHEIVGQGELLPRHASVPQLLCVSFFLFRLKSIHQFATQHGDGFSAEHDAFSCAADAHDAASR